MRRLDLGVNLGILLLGAAISFTSFKMYRYGEVSRPGPGFLPFWCGALISLVSLVLIFRDLWAKQTPSGEIGDIFKGVDPSKPLVMLGSLILYGVIFEGLGFFLSNCFLLPVLLRFVWKRRWGSILMMTLMINLAIYAVFQHLLKVQLPPGILKYLFARSLVG